MSGPIELPAVPLVQVHGQQVTYTGRAAFVAHELMRQRLEQLRQQARATGAGVPDLVELVVLGAAQASADMRTSPDVRESPTPPVLTSDSWIGVVEAADLLGVGERQARRRVEEAGGTRTKKGWRIERHKLLADIELRRTA